MTILVLEQNQYTMYQVGVEKKYTFTNVNIYSEDQYFNMDTKSNRDILSSKDSNIIIFRCLTLTSKQSSFSVQIFDITSRNSPPIPPPVHQKITQTFSFFLIKTVSISSKTPSGVSSKVMDDYCWIHSTFHVRSEYQGNVGCILDNVLAGRDSIRMAAADTPDTAFYQWVPFTLMFQVK